MLVKGCPRLEAIKGDEANRSILWTRTAQQDQSKQPPGPFGICLRMWSKWLCMFTGWYNICPPFQQGSGGAMKTVNGSLWDFQWWCRIVWQFWQLAAARRRHVKITRLVERSVACKATPGVARDSALLMALWPDNKGSCSCPQVFFIRLLDCLLPGDGVTARNYVLIKKERNKNGSLYGMCPLFILEPRDKWSCSRGMSLFCSTELVIWFV